MAALLSYWSSPSTLKRDFPSIYPKRCSSFHNHQRTDCIRRIGFRCSSSNSPRFVFDQKEVMISISSENFLLVAVCDGWNGWIFVFNLLEILEKWENSKSSFDFRHWCDSSQKIESLFGVFLLPRFLERIGFRGYMEKAPISSWSPLLSFLLLHLFHVKKRGF